MQKKEKEQTPGRKGHILYMAKGDTAHMLSGHLETNDGRNTKVKTTWSGLYYCLSFLDLCNRRKKKLKKRL